ncbi:hypothetical protein FDP41_012285 [Naegleria fowleri]|uniref:TFIIS N-terminal domain-containing protein n=1 Tax=Naegleria fowleri TaxID=5763 RepID=A0A6A5C7A3_NAEFO|nr:uncharacterized protein FDP41_012285 [Naegleria fowleri]KAF0981628.1 hypothetical protein FDP41_012285 [Naegleria fowleri]
MSYAPTQVQHEDSEGSEAENDTTTSSTLNTSSLTQSNIATQIQYDTNNEEGDTLEFDEDDDQASEPNQQGDDRMNTTADDEDDEEDQNYEEAKESNKEKSKEKKKRKKKDKSETEAPKADAENEGESPLVHDEDEENEPSEKASKSRKMDEDDEFNIVLKEVKSASRRSTQTEQLDSLGQQQAKELIARIDAAYEDDAESFFRKKPALHKLQLLPELTEACKKIYLQGFLIQEGILKSLERWLVPEKKDLPPPNINIQTGVLNILNDLPVSKSIEDDEKVCITKNHLKSCRIAKAVKQIANNSNTPANNRKIAKKIVEKWSRLVYQLPSDYAEVYKHRRPISMDDQIADEQSPITPRYASASKSTETQPPRKKKLANTNSIRASIPKKESFDFVRLPPSKIEKKKPIVENETHKRLLSVGSSRRK